MPIEIRELHIKLYVSEHESASPEPESQPQKQELAELDQEAIISRCVEAVMEILNRRKER